MTPTPLDAQPVRLGPVARVARWAEMVAVFFGIPAAIALYVDPQRRLDVWLAELGLTLGDPGFPRSRVLIPTLVVFTIVIAVVLGVSKTFPNRQLWNWGAFRAEAPRIAWMFVPGAAIMLGIAWALHTYTDVMLVRSRDGEIGSTFLYLPTHAPIVLAIIAVAYPWFSAYPQEITHRAFFFHRYRPILPGRWSMIGVNAAAFAWLHAPFWNWLALAMTLPAGVLFAWTYDRTRSALAAGFEHAIYGWWVFFTGLGFFVYAGSLDA
ncbi:MAG: CPBP family intramembrane glutamic endopeptidase [Phycisphaerales bacterium]